MSNIEERVVVLKFDNSSFEQNTRQSMKTLDDLNGKLNQTNSAKGLSNLGSAAKSIDLSNIAQAADTINKRFSTMGVVGAAALNKLTDAAVGYGKKILTAIPTQIWQGGWKRALNIEQAKFQIEGLGKLWDQSSVSAKAWSEEVKKAGSEAAAALKFGPTVEKGIEAFKTNKWNEYVKKMGGETKANMTLIKNNVLDAVRGTAAGLDEAGKVASQFAASGMKAGKEMTESLRGIAGASAMTGDSFSNIGNIFTTVAGNGRLMTEQLNQFASRGLNAAATLTDYLNKNKEVRQEAIKIGLASKNGAKDVKEFANATKLTEANVRKLVTAGAINFKTFSHAMSDAFGEHATKANDTYTGSLANMRAALSRIGERFQTQRLENLRKIFNTLTPIIDGIHEKLAPFIDRMNAASKKMTEFFTGGLTKIGKAFGWIKEEEKKAEKSTQKVGEAASNATKKAAKDAQDAGKSLKLTSKEFQAALDIWNKGTYGTGEERVRGLKAVGLSYHRVQSFINAACDAEWNLDKVNYKVTDNMTKSIKKVGDATSKNAKLTKKEAAERKKLEKQLKAEEAAYKKMAGPAKVLFNIVRAFKNLASGFKSIFSTIGAAFKKVFNPKGIKDSAVNIFQLIGNGIVKLSELFRKFSARFAELMTHEKVVNFFVKFFGVLKTVGHYIKVVSLGLFGFVKNIVLAIKNSQTMQRIWNALIAIIQRIGDAIKYAAYRISEFFKHIKQNGTNSSKLVHALKNLWEAIKPLAHMVFDKIADGLWKFIKASGSGSGIIDVLSSALKKIADGMAKVINLAASGIGKVTEFFGALGKKGKSGNVKMEGLGKVTKDAEESQSGLARFITAIKNLDFKGVFSTIVSTIKEGISKIVDLLSGGKFSEIFSKIKGGFAKFDFDKTLGRVWGITKIVAVIKSVMDFGKLASSASNAMLSIGGFFTSLSDTLGSVQENMKKRTNAAVFRDIAIGILLIAASALIISKIDKEGLIKAGSVIGGFLVAMIFLMKYISKLNPDQLVKGAAVLISIGASVLMISIAMTKMARLSWPDIGKGAVAIGALIGIFILVSRLAGQVATGAFAFAGMALAIDLLLPALFVLSKMKGETIMKGGFAILYLAIQMAIAARIAGSNSKGTLAFLAMAAAITAMVPAIVVLAILPFEKALKAVVMLSVLMLTLAGAARLAASSKSSVVSLVMMATVIGTLTAALVILSFVPWPKLLAGAAALTSVFISLGVAGKIAEASRSGMIMIAVILGLMFVAVVALCKLNMIDQAIMYAGSMALLMIAIGVACSLLSKIPIPLALQALANLAIWIFGLVGILAALGGISKIPGLKELVAGGEGLLAQIGHAIGSFIGSIVAGFGEAATAALPKIAENIGNFIEKMKPVLSMVAGIDSKVISGFKNLATALLVLTAAEFLDAITHADPIQKVINFATQIDTLIDQLVPIVPKASQFKQADLKNFDLIAKAVKAFVSIARSIPQNGEGKSLNSLIFGTKDLGKFGKQLGKFMTEWKTVADAVSAEDSTLTEENMTHLKKVIAPAIKAYVDIANAIPQNSSKSLATWVLGSKNLGRFGKQLSTLLTSFAEAAPAAADLTETQCQQLSEVVKPCIKTFAVLNEEIPDNGFSFKQVFAGGSKDLGKFGADLKALIDKFVDVSEKIGKIEDLGGKISNLDQVKTVIKAFAELSSMEGIQNAGDKNLSAMAKDMAGMLPHFQIAMEKAKSIKPESVAQLQSVADSMPSLASAYAKATSALDSKGESSLTVMATQVVNYAKKLNGLDTSNLNKNAEAVKSSMNKILNNSGKGASKAGKNIVSEYAKAIKGGAGTVKKAAQSLANNVKSGLASSYSDFTKKGQSAAKKYVSGISDKKDSAKKAGSSIGNSAKNGLSTKGWYTAGQNCAKGLIRGLDSMKEDVYNSGVALGNAAVQGAKDATVEHSPSKEFAKIGRFSGAGMVIGMRSYEDKVYKAGEELGFSALDGVDESINDITADPTITPVLDLSDVANGAKQIGGMLNGQSVSADLVRENTRMDDLISKIDRLTNQTDSSSSPIMVTMNISGSDDPAAWGERFVAEIKRKSRMGGM